MKHKVKHLHFIVCVVRNRKTIAGGGSARILHAATNAAEERFGHET
jgi:hypothetical protein